MKLLQNMTSRQPSFTVTTEPPVIALNRMGELYSGIENKVQVGSVAEPPEAAADFLAVLAVPYHLNRKKEKSCSRNKLGKYGSGMIQKSFFLLIIKFFQSSKLNILVSGDGVGSGISDFRSRSRPKKWWLRNSASRIRIKFCFFDPIKIRAVDPH